MGKTAPRSPVFCALAAGRGFGLGRGEIALFFVYNLLGILFESVGLGMLLPVFQFVQADRSVDALVAQSTLWARAAQVTGALGIGITLPLLLALSFAAILLRQVFVFLRLTNTNHMRNGLTAALRRRVFDAYSRAATNYQEQAASGALVNEMTTATQLAVTAVFSSLSYLGTLMVFAIYTAMLAAVSLPMTLAGLVVMGLTGVVLRKALQRARKAGVQLAGADRRLSTFLVERLKASRLTRLAGTEAAEREAMSALVGEQRRQYMIRDRQRAEISVQVEPIAAAIAFTFFYVAIEHLHVGIEEIGLFMLVLMRLLPMAKESLLNRQGVIGGLGSIDAVRDRLAELIANAEHDSATRACTPPRSAICFDRVSFAYPAAPDRTVLDGVSVEVPAGATIALVGPSGAGKSTLVDLLPRLRRPTAGRITIDGTPLDEFELTSLRASIAYVSQTAQLLSGTIRGHITYGAPDADDAAIRHAAQLAGAAEFIDRLPLGYDTPLAENGIGLSGGQRQRLDLARALARRASILILDEPTSQLDADSEERFRAALGRIQASGEVTCIIIGHRLSTVAQAHRIVVMAEGRVVDCGTHDELMARGGWYAQAFERQKAALDA